MPNAKKITPDERSQYLDQLKKEYFAGVEAATPDEFKKAPSISIDEKGEISLTLTRELVEHWNLDGWLANYKNEAQHSTGGIRGPQNVLHYGDPRFPLNQIGVMLATLGKS